MERKKSRANPLTIEEIAETTLRLVDDVGLDGLTMRALGAALNCDPMAIYRHVADREELLALVATLVVSEVEIPSPELDARTFLLSFADNARTTFHRHPNAMILIGHSQLSAGTGLGLIEMVAARMAGEGAAGSLADRINADLGALIGYVTLELSPPTSRARPPYLHPDAHPMLAANADDLVGATFGLRSGEQETIPLPGGFELLMTLAVDGVLK